MNESKRLMGIELSQMERRRWVAGHRWRQSIFILMLTYEMQPVCRFTSGVKDVEKYVEHTFPEGV